MNKREFLDRLAQLLSDLPTDEKQDALAFYENYFEDAGPENEARVISELGTPEQVADSIKKDYTYLQNGSNPNYSNQNNNTYQQSYQKKKNIFSRFKDSLESWQFYRENKTLCIVLAIIILIASFPVWSGILGGLIGILFGVLGIVLAIVTVAFSLAIAGIIGGFALIFAGVTTLLVSVGTGLFLIGLGAIFIAIGIVFALAGTAFCGKFLPWVIHSITNAFSGNNNCQAGGATA